MIALFLSGDSKGEDELGTPGICPVSPNPFRQRVGDPVWSDVGMQITRTKMLRDFVLRYRCQR